MSEQVVLTGMVLTSMPIGDYDKRITILTAERGKITAFARGSRRPNSSLLAATSPFAFGQFELYEGKSAYNLSKATIKNYFRELTTNLERMYYGFYFLEFAEYYCQENNDEKQMLKLLYQSMRALESEHFHPDLVRSIFELKAMTINGEGPQVFSCIHCRSKEDLQVFSIGRGGCFCGKCGSQFPGIYWLDSTRYTFQYIVATPIEKLFTFKVSNEVLEEMQHIMKNYMEQYVRHKFKSLQTIEDGKAFLG